MPIDASSLACRSSRRPSLRVPSRALRGGGGFQSRSAQIASDPHAASELVEACSRASVRRLDRCEALRDFALHRRQRDGTSRERRNNAKCHRAYSSPMGGFATPAARRESSCDLGKARSQPEYRSQSPRHNLPKVRRAFAVRADRVPPRSSTDQRRIQRKSRGRPIVNAHERRSPTGRARFLRASTMRGRVQAVDWPPSATRSPG